MKTKFTSHLNRFPIIGPNQHFTVLATYYSLSKRFLPKKSIDMQTSDEFDGFDIGMSEADFCNWAFDFAAGQLNDTAKQSSYYKVQVCIAATLQPILECQGFFVDKQDRISIEWAFDKTFKKGIGITTFQDGQTVDPRSLTDFYLKL